MPDRPGSVAKEDQASPACALEAVILLLFLFSGTVPPLFASGAAYLTSFCTPRASFLTPFCAARASFLSPFGTRLWRLSGRRSGRGRRRLGASV